MTSTRRLATTVATLAVCGLTACGSSGGGTTTAATTAPEVTGPSTAQASASVVGAPATSDDSAPASDASSGAAGDDSSSATATATVTRTVSATPSAARTSSSTVATSSTGASVSVRKLDVDITKRSQVESKLAGTSASFRAYIAARYDKEKAIDDGCETPPHIYVTKYWSDGMATGDITYCGGYATFWWKGASGTWHEYGFQGVDQCTQMVKQGVPAKAARAGLQCLTKAGRTVDFPGDAA